LLNDGGRTLSEYVRKHVVKFESRHSKAILGAVFLASGVTGQFTPIATKVSELTDVGGRNEAASDKVVLEQVCNPLSIFLVGFLPLNGFDKLRVRNNDIAGYFKDSVNVEPILACRLHANVLAIMQNEPITQGSKTA